LSREPVNCRREVCPPEQRTVRPVVERHLLQKGKQAKPMKTGPGPELMLILCDDAARGRVSVDLNAFVEFDLALTRSLRELVAKCPHKRPVNAATGRISSTKRKPK
jgi:hypothetical protein